MANITDLANLDFQDIRNELKEYLKSQSEFTDYDFEGSGISVLLDVLAHNTHMNAMMSHMVMNESFLDSAQIRSNVVSHAQLIGYTPLSSRSSSVKLDLVVQGDGLSPDSVTIPKGAKFTGKINNKEYTFITRTSYLETKLANNTYVFTGVEVFEGNQTTENFIVDGLVEFQNYEISDVDVDIDSLRVIVYPNANTSIGDEYSRFDSAADVGGDSKVFFVKENQFGRYYIHFGDGFVGSKPESGSYVEIEYLTTSGAEANNIITLSAATSIGGISNISVTLNADYTATEGGRDRESTESIRYNAPIKYATQDRAVTTRDYRALILQEFPILSDVSVWGGEEAIPPVYGKVYITPVIKDAVRVTVGLKNSILKFVNLKNVSSVIPEILDVEYTFLKLFVGIQYDLNKTSKTLGEVENAARLAIDEYNDEVLARFSSVFQNSRITAAIDNADPGITSSIVRVQLYKEFRPVSGTASNYIIKFPSKLYIDVGEVNVYSNEFLIDGFRAKMADEATNDPNIRNIYFYDITNGNKLSDYTNVGKANIQTGEVSLTSISFDTTNVIQIFAKPNSYNVAPIFNQLLNIRPADIDVEMSEDTVSSLGSSGLPLYKPFERH